MTANIRKNRIIMMVTFRMFGIPLSKALRASRSPSFLLIILMIRTTLKDERSSESGVSERRVSARIKKSRIFHGYLK